MYVCILEGSGGREDIPVTREAWGLGAARPKGSQLTPLFRIDFQEKTHTYTRKPLNTRGGGGRAHSLTCGFVAPKVDDTHSLEAGTALITSRVDQGEVSI